MDYLYDKVETYDKLKDVIQGRSLLMIWQNSKWDGDIEHHMLHFRESWWATFTVLSLLDLIHERGNRMMVVSTHWYFTTMIYFAGSRESGNEKRWFWYLGTSIFDYIGVPSHQITKWITLGNLRDSY
jgi:hypothetical protein